MGLVHVLENLDAPETLGPAISGAFIATLYGVASANVVFLPVASKLRGISEAELALRELTIEGVLAIQAGDNPRIVADNVRLRLMSWSTPTTRSRWSFMGTVSIDFARYPSISSMTGLNAYGVPAGIS